MLEHWQELGLEPTGDAAAIRRAYAARLKRTRPDEDPEGFAKLRSAYEAILVHAQAWQRANAKEDAGEPCTAGSEAPQSGQQVLSPHRDISPETVVESAPQAIPVSSEFAAIVRKMSEAIDRRDAAAAAEMLAVARDTGVLSLVEGMALADRMLELLVTDRALDGPAVIEASTRLGWYGGPEDHLRSPLLDRLHARVSAEMWISALQTDANANRFLPASRKAVAARLLLGRGPIWISRLWPPEPPLCRLMAELALHWPWIAHRFDRTRIETLEQLTMRGYVRRFAALRRLGRAIVFGVVSVIILGFMYSLGAPKHPGAELSPQEDLNRLLQSARSGDGNAAYNVAVRYIKGVGTQRDPDLAAHWFQQALTARPEAATWLGSLYEAGQGVSQDLAEARRLYENAANRGEQFGQANLARFMTLGRGGPVDTAGAFQWFMRAARQGNPRGLNGVGYSYLIGIGVARDVFRASRWLQAAADVGQPNAMHTLAGLYLQGEAVPKSTATAYFWISLAVKTYPPDDEKRPAAQTFLNQIAPQLAEEERQNVDRAVREWVPAKAAVPPE